MALLLSLFDLIDYKVELTLWVSLSIGFYALGAQLAWHYQKPRTGRVGSWVETLKRWRYHHWLREVMGFLYYIGIPYAALLRGVALPRLMGLTDPDWVKGVGLGVTLGVGTLSLLALIWWWYTRAITALPQLTREQWGNGLGFAGYADGWVLLREVIYLETHWAFYRGATILLLDDDYIGTFLGFLLVTLEWAINPAWRMDLNSPWRSVNILIRWSMAFAMSIIFLLTHNLWVLVPIHWAIETACHRLLAGFSQRLRAQNMTANPKE